MKKVYHLNSCSTCARLLKDVDFEAAGFELQNIKEQNIEEETVEFLKDKLGSYEAFFSKRAMKYKSLGLKEKNLSDDELKDYILDEYTFLKRPVVIDGDHVFVGNAKKTFEAIKKHVEGV